MMKMRMILFLTMPLLGVCGEKAHFKAVDENDRPLPGAKLTLSWIEKADGAKNVCMRKEFVSDSEGRFQPYGSCPCWSTLESVGKEGYEYDEYMNLNQHGPYFPRQYTKETPLKFVFRKIGAEKEVLLGLGSPSDYGIKVVRRGEHMEPIPLWVVRDASGKGHLDADCFALPEFDEMKKQWKCTFWTTNVNGGVQVSTNRVFVAPETGYEKRVEVPLEVCHRPMFTLYAKTFDPQLYAMFSIYGFCPEGRNVRSPHKSPSGIRGGKERPDASKIYGALEIEYCYVNPFGGRVLEIDCATHNALDWKEDDILLPFLSRHRYPPRSNIPVWAEYTCKKKALEKEIREKRNWLLIKQHEREELAKDKKNGGPAVKLNGTSPDEAEVQKRLRECYDEKRRLEAEAPKLNLPE